MPKPSSLDDPEYAAFAWGRYWRLMRWMGLFTLAVLVLSLGLLYARHGPLSIHLYLAAAGGIGAAVLLAAALMGLVLLSSGSGHDQSIEDPFADDIDLD